VFEEIEDACIDQQYYDIFEQIISRNQNRSRGGMEEKSVQAHACHRSKDAGLGFGNADRVETYLLSIYLVQKKADFSRE
jgi:hypothetical protein